MSALASVKPHWSQAYVGQPGQPCWDLVRKVYKAELAIDLPRAGSRLFEATAEPREFDLVLFRLHGLDDHAGVVIEPGWMAHTSRAERAAVTRYDEGKWSIRERRFGRYVGASVAEPEPRISASHINLVAYPEITAHGLIELSVDPGTSVAGMVKRAFPGATDEQRARMLVRINDREIPQADWQMLYPMPGTIVRIDPIPGAFPWRLALGIAVTVAAVAAGQYYALALANSGFGVALGLTEASAKALIVGGATLAGNVAINALIPLPKAKKDREVYSIEGLRNEARPDQPFPNIYGKRRFAPCYFGKPWMEIVGDDVYLHAGFIHGLGDYVISEPRIGDTLAAEYKEVELQTSRPTALVDLTHYDHQVVPTDGMGSRLEYPSNAVAVPVVRITARDAERIEVIVAFPEGLSENNQDGSIDSFDASLRIRARLIGAGTWDTVINPWKIVGKRASAVFRSYSWTPSERGQYEVEMVRVNPEADSPSSHDKVDWVALYAHRPETPITDRYPITKSAIRIKATRQLNGTIDSLNTLVSLVAPDWDAGSSTWITRETANPASIYRYVLQGPQNAKPATDDEIDLVGLQAWHVYCVAKNLKYNRIHDYDDTLPNALAEIAACGRAISRHDGVKWGVVIDKPRTVITAHISAENSWAFRKSRPSRELSDAFMAAFTDSTNGWNRAERIVPRPGFVGTPDIIEPMELPWEIDPATAYREVYRRWLEIDLRRVSYTVSMNIESLDISRGSMVLLNHPRLIAGQDSAEVTMVSGNIVMISRPFAMETGTDYGVRFRRFADGDDDQGTSILRTVQTVPGEQTSLILTGTGELPEAPNLVMFGVVTFESIEAIVKDITRGENFSAQLTLVPHAPSMEALTDAVVVPAWDGRVGDLAPAPSTAPAVPVITDILSSAEIPSGDVRVMVSPGSGGAVVSSYDVQHRLQGAVPWTTVSAPAGTGAAEFGGYATGDILEVQARAIGLTGLQSAYTAIETYEFGEGDRIPENVSAELIFDRVGTNLASFGHITWDGIADEEYEVEYRPIGTTTASVLRPSIGASEVTTPLSDTTSYEARVSTIGGAWSDWVVIPDVTLLYADLDTALAVDADTLLRVS